MSEQIARSVSGDGGRDDVLHEVLVGRGWRSDRAALPEEGDRFEWPPSIPASTDASGSRGGVDLPGRFGTTVHVDICGYEVYGPQANDLPVGPSACYETRDALLRDLGCIEGWR